MSRGLQDPPTLPDGVMGSDTHAMTVEGGPRSDPPPRPSPDSTQQRVAVQERMEELVDRESLAKFKLRLIATVKLGVPVWLLFVPLDVFYVMNGARPLWLLILGRAGPVLTALFIGWDLARRVEASRARMRLYENVMVTGAVVGATVIHSLSGGWASPRLPATALLLMAHAVMLGSAWRYSRVPIALMTIAVPITLLARSAFNPAMAAQLGDGPTMALFAQHYFVVVVAALLSGLGGQIVHSLRLQVSNAKSIGRYRLRRKIATGGMGEVWAAYHAGLGRDVAVKLIQPSLSADRVAIERFEREVRMLAELTHPNTVRVFDYGATEAGVFYYAMELLDARDLQSLVLSEGALEPARAARLIGQCAEALGEAHARGIVHRDLKPANLLVASPAGAAEFVKLIDFGIATEGDGSSGLTRTGMVVGTPGFIAPEVITGGESTPRSDVYALGMVLYVALTAEIPWESDTPAAMVREALERELPPPSARVPRVPEVLDRIVLRCLAKDPAMRFASGAELADTLRAARESLRG